MSDATKLVVAREPVSTTLETSQSCSVSTFDFRTAVPECSHKSEEGGCRLLRYHGSVTHGSVTEGGETGLGAERGKINPNYWQALLAAVVTGSVLPTPATLT